MADNGKSAEKGEDSFAPKGHGKERYRREPEGESTGEGVIRAGGFLPACCVLLAPAAGQTKSTGDLFAKGGLVTKQALFLVRLRVHIRHRVAGVADGLTQGRLI